MKKILLILLCICLPTFSAELSVEATNDGYVSATGDVYNTVRDVVDGTSTSSSNVVVGQIKTVSPVFGVYRGFLSFSLPDMSAVASCSLYLKGTGADYSDDNFNVYIHTSDYGGSIANASYNNFDGWTAESAHTGTVLNDAWNSSSFLVNDWIHIDFNAAGLAALLAAEGTTFEIALVSEEDYNRSEPADKEYVTFTNSSHEGAEPYIALDYTAGEGGFTGTVCGVATPLNVCGVPSGSLANFNGVE